MVVHAAVVRNFTVNHQRFLDLTSATLTVLYTPLLHRSHTINTLLLGGAQPLYLANIGDISNTTHTYKYPGVLVNDLTLIRGLIWFGFCIQNVTASKK